MRRLVRAARRRFGLAGRRVAVRTHVAWYWRSLLLMLALGSGVAVTWWALDAGSYFAGFAHGPNGHELMQLRDKVQQLESVNGQLRSAQVATDRHSQIDSAAQQDTEHALKMLQDENAQLKEELAFFRGISSVDRTAGINIYRFKVEAGGEGVYRYQLLLVQAGQGEKVFQGRLQLVVTMLDGVRSNVSVFPADTMTKGKYSVSVKSYQKLEGDFQLPPASVVKSVEARIYREGYPQPKLTKTVNLS